MPVTSKDTKVLVATFFEKGVSIQTARRAALNFVEKKQLIIATDSLNFSNIAHIIYQELKSGPLSNHDISKLVQKETSLTLEKIVNDDDFGKEESQLSDSLVAMKLLSNSYGGDAPDIVELIQGYDAIQLAASGRNPISLRALTIDYFSPSDIITNNSSKSNFPKYPSFPSDNNEKLKENLLTIKKLDAAIFTLKTLPAAGFHLTDSMENIENSKTMIERLDSKINSVHKSITNETNAGSMKSSASQISRPWILSSNAISNIPQDIHNTLSELGIDLNVQPLSNVMETLYAQRADQLLKYAHTTVSSGSSMFFVGSSVTQSNAYVGTPSSPFPTGHGTIRPVGIGDLLLVKEHVIRYEGGDLAHVENILKTEHLSRDTRRLERTETTILTETETTKEEQRDTQTTDRFSLKRETSDTIKTDSSFKAGISVDAKYGPFVEVKANADFSTSTAHESATKTASEFSKDVVDRSVSKLIERVLERRSTTTISEFEEKYSHGFDNTGGAGHISGYYQWIDKIMQAQIYNYGKRLLFDITVPEPGTNYILAQTNSADQGKSLIKPPVFTLTADQIDEGNYLVWASTYGVVGLDPPPAPIKTISKTYDLATNTSPRESTKSENLSIDEGYSAKYALLQHDWMSVDNDTGVTMGPMWRILIGNNWIDALGTVGYVDMAGETGSVPVAYDSYKMELLVATIEIFCERTERAMNVWRLKTHSAIMQAYEAKLEAYNQALAQALAAAGTVISGRNPLYNTQIMANELRRQCLTFTTSQQFDAFGALELSAEGYAQPNLTASAIQMPYVRFFEQAFEWEHIIYFFYPYFWGWKPAWIHRMMLDDTDPNFADFLRAGAARVVFPVRPGFEAAVIHYLETGEIWNGGPPPDISSSLYVPIVKEIQEATGAPGDETPVGDPWLIHLPTTLVRLRPNDDLPTWKKVNEEWQPTN